MLQKQPEIVDYLQHLRKELRFWNTLCLETVETFNVRESSSTQLFNATLDSINGSVLVENEFIKVGLLFSFSSKPSERDISFVLLVSTSKHKQNTRKCMKNSWAARKYQEYTKSHSRIVKTFLRVRALHLPSP